MHEIHWDKKWKSPTPSNSNDLLLTVERCVEKVGYDWDMGAAQKEILHEAGSHPSAPWEGIMQHEDFGDFREKVDEVLASLSKTLGHAAALKTIERLKRNAVREFVRKRLKLKMDAGAERSLHFGPVEGKDWDGPWRVIGVRRAMTGQYVPGHAWGGWDGEYEYDPPALANRKTHVLLLASRRERYERVVLLKSDTCDWSQKKVAETLMKD